MGTEFYGVAENRCKCNISPKTTTPLYISDNLSDNYILSNQEVILKPNSSEIVSTDLSIAVPEGYVGLIKARKTLAFDYNILIFEDIIHANYRNIINIKMFNLGNSFYKINKKDKIAQILLVPINDLQWVKVDNLPMVKNDETY